MTRYRCKIGHRFSLDALSEAHAEAFPSAPPSFLCKASGVIRKSRTVND
jgi:hypothetical protein